jgi:hypothetical protein
MYYVATEPPKHINSPSNIVVLSLLQQFSRVDHHGHPVQIILTVLHDIRGSDAPPTADLVGRL